MKELSFERMEEVQGGGFFGCASQVTGGLSVLWGVAAAVAFGSNPIGWAVIGVGALSMGFGMISDPYACGY